MAFLSSSAFFLAISASLLSSSSAFLFALSASSRALLLASSILAFSFSASILASLSFSSRAFLSASSFAFAILISSAMIFLISPSNLLDSDCFCLSSATSLASFFLKSSNKISFSFLSWAITSKSLACFRRRFSLSFLDFSLRAIVLFIFLALSDISAAFLSWYSPYCFRYCTLRSACPKSWEDKMNVTLFCTPLFL